MRAVIAAAFPDNPKQRGEITAWQYWDNPFGRTCAQVWEDDGRIVATYAAFPMPAVLGGWRVVAGNGVDAAVDPAYQGRRLFEPLARALYAEAGAAGMAVTLCFINNPLAIRGTTKAGWLEVGHLGVWVVALDDAWLGKRLHVPTLLAGGARRVGWNLGSGPAATAMAAGDVPEGLDELWARAGGVSTGVIRGQDWWRWRYGGHPDRPYTCLEVRRQGSLRGAAVATVRQAFGGRFLYLLELVADGRDEARALARGAAELGRGQGAVGVALLALPGSRLAARAAEAGFRRVPRRLDPKPTSFGAVPNDAAYAHLRSLPWSVSWGDLDHV